MGVGDAEADEAALEAATEQLGVTGTAPERTAGPRVFDRLVQGSHRDAGGRRDLERGAYVGVRRSADSIAIPRIRDFRGSTPARSTGAATIGWASVSS